VYHNRDAENRVAPWEVARLGPVTRFREPQLTPRFGRKMPRVEQIVSGKGTRNAAPLRAWVVPRD
jgi:hypothetical protein